MDIRRVVRLLIVINLVALGLLALLIALILSRGCL